MSLQWILGNFKLNLTGFCKIKCFGFFCIGSKKPEKLDIDKKKCIRHNFLCLADLANLNQLPEDFSSLVISESW